MKKEYRVDVDITCSAVLFVDAENEELAKQLVKEKIMKEQSFWLNKAAVIDVEVTDVDVE